MLTGVAAVPGLKWRSIARAGVLGCAMASSAGLAQSPTTVAPLAPAALTVPEGFGVSVFASGLTGARLMAVSPEGTLVVARRAEVVALPDADGDGVAETWLNGEAVSGRPVGIVSGADGALYVSDDNKGFVYRVFVR
jgi:glucose/arabinose dehydrogenase